MADKLNIPPAIYMMHRRQFMKTAAAGTLAAGAAPMMAFAQDAVTEILRRHRWRICRVKLN